MPPRRSTTRGFKRTDSVLSDRIRRAGESRGFAVSRMLTHWTEIVGPEIAAIARPANISYGRGGFGATLTVLTTGPHAVMLEMQKQRLREKVNAVYGYNAIARVRISQTAPDGFHEGQALFEPAKKSAAPPPDPQIYLDAAKAVSPVANDDLRAALERLGQNVLSNSKR